MRIRVRGTNSISKSNDPLYVVDGIVRESGLDSINPEDIHVPCTGSQDTSSTIYIVPKFRTICSDTTKVW